MQNFQIQGLQCMHTIRLGMPGVVGICATQFAERRRRRNSSCWVSAAGCGMRRAPSAAQSAVEVALLSRNEAGGRVLAGKCFKRARIQCDVGAQVSERDDRLLTDQLLALEKANQEVAGDSDSEGEEPEGMCAPCRGSPGVQPCHLGWS